MKKNLVLAFLLIQISIISAQSNDIGSGIALSVNGVSNNYLDLGDVFNDLNFPLTVEAWVNPTSWTPGGYSPIIATDNVGVGGSYFGFWFRFNSSGKLIFEIGDGSGSGGSDRRGKVTTSAVALNKWTHVAVVATSITDIKFYFNGVLQLSSSTDGGASNTSIVHSGYPAIIGGHITPTTQHNFTGQIDEVRIWDTVKTESDLRDNLCLKTNPISPYLIGYWSFNESYGDPFTINLSEPTDTAYIVGSVTKVTSGAPIGDAVDYLYTTDYSGLNLTLNSAGGDKMKINKIGNNPHGVHLYRVDSSPYSTIGLINHPNYYFGVFTADGATSAKYNSNYIYSFTNGVITPINEELATVFQRVDGSVTTWTDFLATLSIPNSSLVKKNCVGRGEYILNIPIANEMKAETTPELEVFPNPCLDYVITKSLSSVNPIVVSDIHGKIIKHFTDVAIGEFITLDLSMLPAGNYFISQQVNGKNITSKIIKQ